MEPARKGRKRSKSFYSEVNTDESANNADLNGDEPAKASDVAESNDGVETVGEAKSTPDEDIDTVKPKDGGVVESSNNSKSKGRKRKASDMESGDDDSVVSDEGSKGTIDKENVNKGTNASDKSNDGEEKKTDDQKKEKDNAKAAEFETNLDKDNASVSSSESTDMNILTPQDMGKGKRARIPNKRYSDILLSPVSKQRAALVENGEKIEAEIETPKPATSSSGIATPTHISKKPKLAIDVKDPIFLLPIEQGWKRELVYRANDRHGKRDGDVYYYTPTGKKVRSMREVSENLKNTDLTLNNFTFFKEPLGLDDPEKEIIRVAVPKSKSVVKEASKKVLIPKSPKPKPEVVSKVMNPKVLLKRVSPRYHVSSETAQESPGKPKTPAKLGNFKIKLPPKKMEKKAKLDESSSSDSPSTSSTTKWPAKKTGNWNNSDSKPCQPCSIRCEGVIGLVPTLQCRLCLCLYHNECVGLRPHLFVKAYVCKNCQLEQENQVIADSTEAPLVAPPPLTPITALKSLNIKQTSLPKLQRIPTSPQSPNSSPRAPEIEMPPLMPRPPKLVKVSETFTPQENINKSLVGSVTTWLPQNSKIQVDNHNSDNSQKPNEIVPASDIPRPQYVEYLAGRKFLIIPKHNIVSVAASVAQSCPEDTADIPEIITERTSVVSPSHLGVKGAEEIKPEPVSPTKPDNSLQNEPMEVDTVQGGTVLEEQATLQSGELQNEKNKESPRTPKKKPISKLNSSTSVSTSEKTDEVKSMNNYLQQISYGYNTLLYVFQYLKVQDLLRAGCVCNMWRDIASHPYLWRTVRMKNSQVHSFEGLANTLQKHGTVHLDLRKMLLPNGGDEIWPHFNKAIEKVTTLRKIELCRCPASVVEHLATSNPKLEVINAVTIKCENMNLDQFSKLQDLKELRLKSTSGLTLTSNLDALKDLTNLKHLSLTSIRDLNKLNLNIISELTNLESLDLGECNDFPKTFGTDILEKLKKLEKLRLEKGQGNCYTFDILEAVKNMPQLEQLELVNFDIKAGFDKALGGCANIKRLLIIPTYISQSATTNHMVLGGVLRLQKTLSHFVWGVTLELLRVTELFVDQCEEPDSGKENGKDKVKKPTGNGDSIPVLKPVPSIGDKFNMDIPPAHDPPQVEILPLPNLQKLLLQSLPTTRVKILKIPFHATWRQSITDTVN